MHYVCVDTDGAEAPCFYNSLNAACTTRRPTLGRKRHEFIIIESKYFSNPCEFRLALLLATQNERALKIFALFLYKAFSRRKTLVS